MTDEGMGLHSRRLQKIIHRAWLGLRVPDDLALDLCKLSPCACEVREVAIRLLRQAVKAKLTKIGKEKA